MKAVLARLLAHPSFYYRFDHEGAIVEGKEGEDALYRLSRWELLSKLTFLFWHAPPTDALYDRVEGSDITKEENLRPLVDEVLADSKSESGVLRFFREWLTLDKTQRPGTEGNVLASQALILAATGEDALPPSHREDMIAEVLDLARHYALTTEGSFDDILTSPYSFARTPALAKIYGVAPWDGAPERLVRLPDGQRSGLLTRAALVAANGEYTRPILKGERILSHILCRTVPPPPPTLEIKPLIQTSTKTTREVTDEATNPAGCASCHQMLNPLGFASESYDAIGRFRMKELRFEPGGANVAAELALDTKALVRMPSGKVKEVKDAVELSAFVAESGEAHGCLVQNYFEFATGRPNEQLDACEVESLGKKLTTGTRSLKGMLRESVLLQSFRQRKVK